VDTGFPPARSPSDGLSFRRIASAGEGSSEKIMLKQQAKAKRRFNQNQFRLSAATKRIAYEMAAKRGGCKARPRFGVVAGELATVRRVGVRRRPALANSRSILT
jgi:hypothetical protein